MTFDFSEISIPWLTMIWELNSSTSMVTKVFHEHIIRLFSLLKEDSKRTSKSPWISIKSLSLCRSKRKTLLDFNFIVHQLAASWELCVLHVGHVSPILFSFNWPAEVPFFSKGHDEGPGAVSERTWLQMLPYSWGWHQGFPSWSTSASQSDLNNREKFPKNWTWNYKLLFEHYVYKNKRFKVKNCVCWL